jgi:DedD protein
LEYRLSTPFQNRLVGTIIVAAAVIIFLPDVLDGKKKSNQTDFDAIPQAPTFTGKMTNNAFPEEDLVLKEKEIVFNEEAKDEELIANSESNKTINQKIKVTPATKVRMIDSETRSNTHSDSAIEKPILGQTPSKAITKEAWVIQLGSFKHKSNVAELVNKLKGSGYSVFTKPIQTKQGTLTKVFVGPELIKASLAKKIPALKKLTNVQGKVARFYPTQ